jgi:hypothetical protein
MSEVTPRSTILCGSVVSLNGGTKGDSSVNVDTSGTSGLDSESEVGEMVIDVREIGCRAMFKIPLHSISRS